jgi:hypothetical protein
VPNGVQQDARLTLNRGDSHVERVLRSSAKRRVTAEFGFVKKSVGKWTDRFQTEGRSGLSNHLCQPRRRNMAVVRPFDLAWLVLH